MGGRAIISLPVRWPDVLVWICWERGVLCGRLKTCQLTIAEECWTDGGHGMGGAALKFPGPQNHLGSYVGVSCGVSWLHPQKWHYWTVQGWRWVVLLHAFLPSPHSCPWTIFLTFLIGLREWSIDGSYRNWSWLWHVKTSTVKCKGILGAFLCDMVPSSPLFYLEFRVVYIYKSIYILNISMKPCHFTEINSYILCSELHD